MADHNAGSPPGESMPLVTAVIPTRNRPELVARAVRSALGQTYKELEVVVVIDGPDPATVKELATLSGDRLRVIALPGSLGPSAARNAGVEAARGMWIALLDDDDEWLPAKIDLQMQRASSSRFRYPIVSSQIFGRSDHYEVVWPRFAPYQPLSEYLLARNSWSFGEGLMQTTTLLFPRELFCQMPFRSELREYEDWDWVLRAAKHDDVGIEFISQPLAVWNIPAGRSSASSTTDWQTGLKWIDSVREIITPRAYASFVATRLSSQAAKRQDWSALWPLFKTMVKWGKPNFRDLSLYFAMWFAPQRLRFAMRKANR